MPTASGQGPNLERALESLSLDPATTERIRKLPPDIAWLLISAGLVGVVVPGVLGVPFLLLGGIMLAPRSSRRAQRWLSGHAPQGCKVGVRQVNRFLDDLERRYPRGERQR